MIPGVGAVAPLPDGLLVSTDDAIIRLDEAGAQVARWRVDHTSSELVTSPDGRWFAITGHEGVTWVYREGDDHVYVNPGLGGAVVAKRLGRRARPTVAHITLRPAPGLDASGPDLEHVRQRA